MSLHKENNNTNMKMTVIPGRETKNDKEHNEIKLLEIRNFDPDSELSKTYTDYNFINEDIKKDCGNALLWPQVLAAVAAGFVHLGLGVVGGYTGVALPSLTDRNSSDVYLNIDEASLFNSIPAIAFIVGSFLTGLLMNWFGQRIALIISIPFGIAGWLILFFTSNINLLIASRFLMGLVGGACTTACNIYVAEIAHTSVRGRLMAIIDLMRQIGFIFVVVLGSINLHWRYVGLIGGLVSLLPPLIALLFLPNSPRWLATKGRRAEAKKALDFFRGPEYDVDKEIEEIVNQLENSMKDTGFINQLKLLKNRTICQRFVVLGIMLFLAHFSGNIISAMYTISIFKSANTGIDEYVSTVISVSMRLFGIITYILIADKFNRKTLLIFPSCFTSLSMISLGTYFYLMLNHNVQSIYWLPLVSMSVYLYGATIYFSVLMLFGSELLPTSIRTFGGSINFFLLNLGSFIVVYIYPYMIESIGSHWTFWFYGFNGFVMITLAALFLPETKGKTLEQIGDLK